MRWSKVLLAAAMLLIAGVILIGQTQKPTPVEAGSSSASLGLMLLDGERCVQVLAVTDRSPAYFAGFQPGDAILRYGVSPVEDREGFEQLLKKEKTMEFLVRRGETELQLKIPFR